MKSLTILIVIILLQFSLNSCHKEKTRIIESSLLQSDWLNAKYFYVLFFNDSTVLTPPNDNGQFVYRYLIDFDTLYIENIDYKNRRSWEKYQVLTLNSDILIMKNISKNNVHLSDDTISLINTKTINCNNLSYKKIFFSYSSLTINKELEIRGDSLTFTEYDFNKNKTTYRLLLSNETINNINRKLELLDPATSISSVPAPGVPSVSLKIEFNEPIIPIDLKGIDPTPNLRVAGLIAYLRNLDVILNIKKEK